MGITVFSGFTAAYRKPCVISNTVYRIPREVTTTATVRKRTVGESLAKMLSTDGRMLILRVDIDERLPAKHFG
jgi:hypothetical protein